MAINLSSIIDNKPKPPRICCYGPEGIGKTTLAANAPKPIFIQSEDGLGKMKVKTFGVLKSFNEVIEAIGTLYTEKHKFKTLVIDTVDWLEPVIWRQLINDIPKSEKGKVITSIEDYGYGKGYTMAMSYWHQLVDGLNALRDKGMIIILLSHMQLVRVEDPTRESYDKCSLKLHKKASALITEYFCDVILYACMHVSIAKEDEGFNKTRTRAVTNGKRIMYTTGQPSFLAKNRYDLPEEIDLNWEALYKELTR